jgi:hypothetical protein
MPVNLCPDCGHEIAPGTDVCTTCGKSLATAETVSPQSPAGAQPDTRSVVLSTFASQLDAQVAATHLEDAGIPVVVNSDDCGGLLPQLSIIGGYRLLVSEADRPRAAAALQEIAQEFGVKPGVPPGYSEQPSNLSPPSKPKAHLVMLGLFALGMLVGGMAHYALTLNRSYYTGTDSRDLNEDGQDDAWWTYRDGRCIELSLDRNFDGRRDSWTTFDKEHSSSIREDNNFDGKPDLWYAYSKEVLTYVRFDADFDGKQDGEMRWVFGVPTETQFAAPNRLGYWKRDFFTNGLLRECVVDRDRDGVLDERVLFDPFGVVLRVEPLK